MPSNNGDWSLSIDCRSAAAQTLERNPEMAFVITEPCIGVKDGSCVKACPVDCIEGRPEDAMLYIDKERCIDCDVCATVCPVDAIYPDNRIPQKWAHYRQINDDYFKKAMT
jgi:ferredoxin